MPVTFKGTTLRNTTYLSQWSPQQLFTSNEQGVWVDPSDMSTMFQDAAGTTPVTALEQPVGLILDKRNTAHSIAFNGSSTTLSTPNSLDLRLGNTYTIEAWVYQTATAVNPRVYSDGSNGVENVDIYVEQTTNYVGFCGGSVTSTYSLPLNTWVHLAFVVNSGVATFYANGVQKTLSGQTTSVSSSSTNTRYIGSLSGAGYYWSGYISNLRVVKGVAVYSGAFSPPSSNLSPITGTVLLACGVGWTGNPVISNTTTPALPNKLNPFKAGTGNHLWQSTSTSRPVLSARVNLLTYTEDFRNTAAAGSTRPWLYSAASVTADSATAPNGTATADLLYPTSSGTYRGVYQNGSGNLCSIYAKAAGKTKFGLVDITANTGAAWYDLSAGTSVANAGYTATIIPVGDGWFRCTLSHASNFVQMFPFVVDANNSASVTANGTDGIYIWGADLRAANDGIGLPGYQLVNTAADYDVSGFPYYLKFDGVDDGLLTASIDFTNTDRITTFVGIRKLSDVAAGVVFELSDNVNNNNGSFAMAAPENTGINGNYSFKSRGTVNPLLPVLSTTILAPTTNVVTCIGVISTDVMLIRSNGAQVGTSIADQGTGNFGNFPLYVGRRNNSSVPLNGRLYGLIICGASEGSGEISNTETWINNKTKAY